MKLQSQTAKRSTSPSRARVPAGPKTRARSLDLRKARPRPFHKDAYVGPKFEQPKTVEGLQAKPMTEYDPNKKGYNAENGAFLGQAAKLAYEDKSTIKKYTKAWGFKDAQFIENKKTDAQAFVAYDPKKNTVLVSFRGTESVKDAVVDAKFLKTDGAKYGGGKVHTGFAGQLDSILKDVDKSVKRFATDPNNPPKIMVAGHSLGGALANLYTSHANKNGMPVSSLVTIGQPKVGDKAYTKKLDQSLKANGTSYVRYVNNNDIVPHVPPTLTHGKAGLQVDINRHGDVVEKGQGFLNRTFDRAMGYVGEVREHGVIGVADGLSDHSSNAYVDALRAELGD